jgi:hypothetical protein
MSKAVPPPAGGMGKAGQWRTVLVSSRCASAPASYSRLSEHLAAQAAAAAWDSTASG